MKKFTFFLLISVFFYGCSPYNNKITKHYDSKHYDQTYKTLQDATQTRNKDWLLWKMQSGFLTFSYFAPHFSIHEFEEAEEQFKIYEERGILSNISTNIGAALSNDMTIPYYGLLFEGSLLNLYKALAFASIGDSKQARIEFNRANDRQRRAKDYYAKEITKAHQRILTNANEDNIKPIYQENIGDEHLDSILHEKYSNLKFFSIYKDLVNPAIPYLSGLFFMIERDYNKSLDLLKEAYGITRTNLIAQDMNLLTQRQQNKKYPVFTWIIIEDGNIMRKTEMKTSLPIIGYSGFSSFNLALPYLENGRPTYTNYTINKQQAELISDISKLFASEFEKQLPTIIARSIIGALVKFGLTYSLNTTNNEYAMLAGLLSTIAFQTTTMADIRSSFILPNQIWALRIPNTESNIQILGNNHNLLHLELTDTCNTLQKRMQSKEKFDILLQTKPNDIQARIDFFKKYKDEKHGDTLCNKTDNIVYVRVNHNTLTYAIIKGD